MLITPLLLLAPVLLSEEGYRRPPQAIAAVIEAPPPPQVRLSPDGSWMLLVEHDALPSLADLARPMEPLAGARIDPVARGPHTTKFARGLVLRDLHGERNVRVPLAGHPVPRLDRVSWSHDGRHFAYTVVTPEGTELWSASVESAGEPRRVTDRLSSVLFSFRWMPDGRTLLYGEAPEQQGDAPAEPPVPPGPTIEETSGATSPLRTYQDLLAAPHDADLFEHLVTVQLRMGSPFSGEAAAVGAPGMLVDVSPSPDGEHLYVERLERPFSYSMPWWRFPRRLEVWDLEGGLEHLLAEVPLGEGIPIQGVRTGPRSARWVPGRPATLAWVEALDGGDPEREVPHRDRWLAIQAPFEAEPRELFLVEHRAFGLDHFPSPSLVATTEYDRDRRWVRVLLHDLDSPESEPRVLEDRSVRDRYGDPGDLVHVPDSSGHAVVLVQDGHVLRKGRGATEEGFLPFLDRQRLEDLETERLWRCEPGAYERVALVLEEAATTGPRFVTVHESPDAPPNYRLHEPGADEPAALTSFPDPTPEIRGISKELLTYERADGVQLSATLYMPPGYEEGTRLPLLVWAYPIEFNDAGTAGQVGTSPWRFTRIRGSSHLALLLAGYAVLDGATMPVIGDPETMNDTFVEQIVSSAEAAVAAAVERGVADPDRVAVGGHSYGAFMTANLLAHCDVFRAGIARSGAYNRSLTPFGFQSERRTVWEAVDTYVRLSPFFHAEKIDEPLLLIHGERDSNSGTYPMQSRRLYQAIQGNGGTARLVMLPLESHGYRARASVMHVLAEMHDYLARHVANAPPRVGRTPAGAASGGR